MQFLAVTNQAKECVAQVGQLLPILTVPTGKFNSSMWLWLQSMLELCFPHTTVEMPKHFDRMAFDPNVYTLADAKRWIRAKIEPILNKLEEQLDIKMKRDDFHEIVELWYYLESCIHAFSRLPEFGDEMMVGSGAYGCIFDTGTLAVKRFHHNKDIPISEVACELFMTKYVPLVLQTHVFKIMQEEIDYQLRGIRVVPQADGNGAYGNENVQAWQFVGLCAEQVK